jgi:hypothetical protein
LRKLIVILIILSLVAKVFLLGKGYLSIPDEFRHISSQNAVEYLRKGEVKQAAKQLFDVQGRPGLTLVGMIPAAFQNIVANGLKVGYNGIEAAWVIYIFNFVIFLTILFLIFRIALLFSIPDKIALLVVLLYSVSINGYIYLRHVFPYDFSLMLLLFALWFFASKKASWNYRHGFIFGLITSFAFIVYPGYFPIVFALGFFYSIVLFSKFRFNLLIRHSLISAAGGVLMFAFFELLSQYSGTSYLLDMQKTGEMITQGSFEESFSYVFKYLWQAEFPLGTLYLISLFLGTFFLVKDFRKATNKDINYLYLSVFMVFVIYAALGQVFHKMVFYGRLVHQFYPFLTLLFGYLLQKIFLLRPQWPIDSVIGFTAIAALFLSLPNHFAFAKVYYPREIIDKVKPFESNYQIVSFCERKTNIENSFGINNDVKYKAKSKLFLINCCYPTGPDMSGDFSKFVPPNSVSLLFSYNHFINLTAYQFEGGNIEKRAQYRKNPLYIRAYK